VKTLGAVQRLLQGRWLYAMLACVVLILYVRMAGGRPAASPEVAPPQELPSLWEARPGGNLQGLAAREPSLALVLVGLSVFISAMGLGGIGFFLWGVLTGRIRTIWQFASRRLPRWSFGEVVRITLLTLVIGGLLPFVRMLLLSNPASWAENSNLWLSTSMLFLDLFVILAILTFAAGKGVRVREMLGFSAPRLPEAMRIGFRGYLALFPWLFLLLYLVTETARWVHFKPPLEPIHELIFREAHPAVLIITVVLACLIGPLAEELFFRGVVYGAIRQRTSRIIAMLVSGAVFSLIHTNVMGFVPIMVLGWLLAYLYERTGSLLVPLAVHILHNTFLMSLALTFRQMMALQ